MKKFLFSFASLFMLTLMASAQIKAEHIIGISFDSLQAVTAGVRTYAKDIVAESAETSGLQEVKYWTPAENGDAHAGGIFAYGDTVSFLGGTGYYAPAAGPSKEVTGNTLGVVAVWGATSQYTKSVPLSAGIYKLVVPVYNAGGTGAMAKNLIGIDGNYASATTYAVGEWTNVEVSFVLQKDTKVALSLGYTGNGGSGSMPHLFFGNIDIYRTGTTAEAYINMLNKLPLGNGLFRYNEAAVKAAKDACANVTTTEELKAAQALVEKALATVTYPEEGKVYYVKNAASEGNLCVANSKATLAKDAVVMFTPVNGGFAISNHSGEYIYKTTDNGWTFSTTTNIDDAYVLSVNPVDGGYTFSGSKGLIGSDATAEGSELYADKKVEANGLWDITLVTFPTKTIHTCEADVSEWTRTFTGPGQNGNFERNTWSVEADASGLKTPFVQSWVWGGAGAQLSAMKIQHNLITDLENGSYDVKILIRAFNEMAGSSTPTGISFTANGNTVNFSEIGTEGSYNNMAELYGNLTIPAQVTDGTLDFSINIQEAGLSWIAFKNFQVVAQDSNIPEVSAVEGEMGTAAADAQNAAIAAFNANPTPETYQAVLDAQAAAQKSMNNYAALRAMKALIDGTNVYGEGYDAYVQKYNDYMDQLNAGTLTETVVNPNSATGWHSSTAYNFLLTPWTIAGEPANNWDKALYINTWSIEGESDGSNFLVPFFEYWTGDANSLGATTLATTISGLKPGKTYNVSVDTRVRMKNGTDGQTATGITFQAGDSDPVDACAGAQVGETQFRLMNVQTSGVADADGNLTLAFNVAEDNNISWLSYKNVKYSAVYAYDYTASVGSSYEGAQLSIDDYDDILASIGATASTLAVYYQTPDGARVGGTASNAIRSNTDGWHNAEGAFQSWGDDAYFYVQDNADLGLGQAYYLGAYPGKTDDPVSFTAHLVYVNTETNAEAPVTINLNYVEVNFEIAATVKTHVQYDLTEGSYTQKVATLTDNAVNTIKTALGISDLSEATVWAYNPSTQKFLSGYNGTDGWRDANGDLHSWTGDATAPVCVKCWNESTGEVDLVNYTCYNIQVSEEQAIPAYYAICNEGTGKAVLVKVTFYYGAAPAALANVDYVIKNVEAGKYLNGANSWGTKASVTAHGQFMTVATIDDGVYTIDSHYSNGGNNHYLGSNGYVDSGATNLEITEVGNGIFSIKCGDNYLAAAEDGTANFDATEVTEAAQWQFLTKEDILATLDDATETNPVDVTAFVRDANFSRNNLDVSYWDIKPSVGGPNENKNAEKWGGNSETFVSSQAITDLPNGVYILKAQGFYRYNNTSDNTNDIAIESHANGTEIINSYLFANDYSVALKSIADDEASSTLSSLPFSQTEAANAFNAGLYQNSLVFAVTDGTMNLGIKKIYHPGCDWTVWDNFELYCVSADSNADIAEIAAHFATSISTVPAATKATKANGKFFENGKVVIYRNGLKYNAMGVAIK